MSQFSALRESAGYELLDVVDQFDAGYKSVVRWESGAEQAPARILRALEEISRLAPSFGQSAESFKHRRLERDSANLSNSLFEGDCLDILRQISTGSVDLILCDLPYGTTQNRWDSVIDLDRLWSEYRRVLKPTGVVVLTAQGVFTAKLILSNERWFKYKIVWEKSKSTNFLNAKKQPLRKHEDICVFYSKSPTYNPQMRAGEPYDKGIRKNQLSGSYGDFQPSHVRSAHRRYVREKAESLRRIQRADSYDKGIRKNQLSGSYGDFQPSHVRSDGERYPADIIYFKTAESEHERTVWHPTQKPVELGRYLVRTFSHEGDLVLDNAFGSGSFLVAAAMEKRRFIGIERNQEVHLFKNGRIDYIALAAERLTRVGAIPHVIRC